jgi:hypothetical protein
MKILCYTLIENIKRVTNMRMEYMNWAQEKILYSTLVEKNIRKGSEYVYIECLNWTQKKKNFMAHTDRKISERVTDIKSTNWTQSPVD